MLTVRGRSLGRRKPLFADFSVPAPPLDGTVTLRELIEVVVRHEVAAFEERQREGRFLVALTEREIAEQEAAGRVLSGERPTCGPQVDADRAVRTAIEAFEDQLYFVVVDEEQQRDLDAPVPLRDDSQLTFLRLTQLAGG